MQKKIRRAVGAALFLLAGSFLATPALGQTVGFPEVKLTVSDRVGIGFSVALSGDTALIGAGDESAYVFVRNGTTWTQSLGLREHTT